jgi:hypothetical protein
VLPRVPAAPDPLQVPESSDISMCFVALGTSPARQALQCHHVSRASRPAPGTEGFDVTMCPIALGLPFGKGGLWSRRMSHGSRPVLCVERLWHRHVSEAPEPPPDRAPVSSCVLWLRTRLPVQEGFGASTCPMALSLRGVPVRS